MGLFSKKKTLPELPKPEMHSQPQSSMPMHENLKLPDFSMGDFPSYEPLSPPPEMGSIKRAVKSMPPVSDYEPEMPKQSSNDKTLFVKIDDYETAIAAIERLKEKLKDVESVINNIEKLKRQEDAELDAWHKDIDSLKQRIMTVEAKLFRI